MKNGSGGEEQVGIALLIEFEEEKYNQYDCRLASNMKW